MPGRSIQQAVKKSLAFGGVILLSAAVIYAKDPQADTAYKTGRALLKEGKSVAAYVAFEKATSLDPGSSRYRRALNEAMGPALDEAVRLAPQLATSNFSGLLILHAVCQGINAADPRAVSVERALQKARAEIEIQISQAEEKARNGDFSGARRLLEPVVRYRNHFPSLNHAEEEVAFRESLQIGRESAAQGSFRQGLEATQKALAMRPGDSDALSAQAFVAEGLMAKAQPMIAEKASSGHLSDLALAVVLLDEVERVCLPCQGRIGDTKQLRSRLQEQTLTLLAEIMRTKSQPAEWAACGIVAEARSILGESSKDLFAPYCPESVKMNRLRLGISVQAPENCVVAGLASRIETALPSTIMVIPVTGGAGGTSTQHVDLQVSLEIERCSGGTLGDSEVKTQTSTYVAGVQQLSNPQFVQLQSQLRSAQIEQARLQGAASANPNDLGASIALVAVAVQIGNLSKRLRETNPYTESPIRQPYTYEVFKAGSADILEGAISFEEPADSAFFTRAPLQVRHEAWAPGVRGVYPTDSSGLKNQEPVLPTPESLHSIALQRLGEQIERRVGEFMPVWLAAKASSALNAKNPFDALGYLTILRVVTVPPSDPDLLTYKEKYLTTQLLNAAEIQNHHEPLSTFETRLRRSAETENSRANKPAGPSQFLEKALRAVVVVRRGDQEGTGFLISANGLILTNFHVVEAPGNIVVETSEGEQFLASLVGQSPEKDLALLQIPSTTQSYLQLASTEEAQIGDDVYTLGTPRGLQGTVTKGIISAKRRLTGVRLVQIDAPINPGNSGGPLLRSDGRVIGINTLKLRESEGLNFAISIDEAKTAFAGALGQ